MNIDIYSVIDKLKNVRMKLPAKQELPDDALIDEYENDLGLIFPDEYRLFLREAGDSVFNGKDALRITIGRNHPRELLQSAREAWKVGVPKSWLPFCEDNGNYYCLLDTGEVRFWAHDGPSSERWETLADWINNVWLDE